MILILYQEDEENGMGVDWCDGVKFLVLHQEFKEVIIN
jgi:hypothetical protein